MATVVEPQIISPRNDRSEMRIAATAGAILRTRADGATAALTAPNGEPYDHCFIASTERVATDGGIIKVSAWDVPKMRRRWISNHDIYGSTLTQLVLGQIVHAEKRSGMPTVDVGPSGNALVEYVRYASTPFAQDVKTLFDEGALDEVSVRWDPRTEQVRPPYEEEVRVYPDLQWVAEYVVQLELSAVLLAADAGAVMQRGTGAPSRAALVPMVPAMNPRVLEAFERVRAHGAGKALPELAAFIRRVDLQQRIFEAVDAHMQMEREMDRQMDRPMDQTTPNTAREGAPPMSASDVLAGEQTVGGPNIAAATGTNANPLTAPDVPPAPAPANEAQALAAAKHASPSEATCAHCGTQGTGDAVLHVCTTCYNETPPVPVQTVGAVTSAAAPDAHEVTGRAEVVGDTIRISFEMVHPLPTTAGNVVPPAVTTANDAALEQGVVRDDANPAPATQMCQRCMERAATMDLCNRCYGSMDAANKPVAASANDGTAGRSDAATNATRDASPNANADASDTSDDPDDDGDQGGQSSDGTDDSENDENDGDSDSDTSESDAPGPNSADNAKTATATAVAASQSALSEPTQKSHTTAKKAHLAAAALNKHAFKVSGNKDHAANALMHEQHAQMHGQMAKQHEGDGSMAPASAPDRDDADVGGMGESTTEDASVDSMGMERALNGLAALAESVGVRFNQNHDDHGKFAASASAKANAASAHAKTLSSGASTASEHEAAAQAHIAAAKAHYDAAQAQPDKGFSPAGDAHLGQAQSHLGAAWVHQGKANELNGKPYDENNDGTKMNKKLGRSAGVPGLNMALVSAPGPTIPGNGAPSSSSVVGGGQVQDNDANDHETNDAPSALDHPPVNAPVPAAPNDVNADPDGDADQNTAEGALPHVNLIDDDRAYDDAAALPAGEFHLSQKGSVRIGGFTVRAAAIAVPSRADQIATVMRALVAVRGMDVGAAQDVLMAIAASMDALDAVLSAIGPVREQLDGNFAELRNLLTANIDASDDVKNAVSKAIGGEPTAKQNAGHGDAQTMPTKPANAQGGNKNDEPQPNQNRSDAVDGAEAVTTDARGDEGADAPELFISLDDLLGDVTDETRGKTVPSTDAEKQAQDDKYGADAHYADPKNHKYPLGSKEEAKAAWSYINMPKNAAFYSAADLAAVKSKIKAACKKFGVEISDDTTHAVDVSDEVRIDLAALLGPTTDTRADVADVKDQIIALVSEPAAGEETFAFVLSD